MSTSCDHGFRSTRDYAAAMVNAKRAMIDFPFNHVSDMGLAAFAIARAGFPYSFRTQEMGEGALIHEWIRACNANYLTDTAQCLEHLHYLARLPTRTAAELAFARQNETLKDIIPAPSVPAALHQPVMRAAA
ncbi:MAG: hypothetical protein V4621_00540 [Pseudomonadota bacterium]